MQMGGIPLILTFDVLFSMRHEYEQLHKFGQFDTAFREGMTVGLRGGVLDPRGISGSPTIIVIAQPSRPITKDNYYGFIKISNRQRDIHNLITTEIYCEMRKLFDYLVSRVMFMKHE